MRGHGRALEAEPEYEEQFVETWPALVLAVLSTMLVFAIAGWSIYNHLLHYTKPEQQRYIIRLLLATPLYSLSRWGSGRAESGREGKGRVGSPHINTNANTNTTANATANPCPRPPNFKLPRRVAHQRV